ncbi:MAG: hypothetical protein IJC90_04300 [Clostridia bacterium]|nr:hypothetical protein [Clostridia bacterium]
MKKTMKRITVILLVLSVVFVLLNIYLKSDLFLILSITFCTALYHFVMRLFVGEICNKFIEPNLNCNSKWFKEKKFEKKLYKLLKVKKWKKFAPTYSPESFSLEKNSKEDIIRTMCGAEVVHELIIVFSFLPIIFSGLLDSFYEFLFTSIIAALVDSVFVIIQRFNRPRVIKLLKRSERQSGK